jgi:hypothetical protein
MHEFINIMLVAWMLRSGEAWWSCVSFEINCCCEVAWRRHSAFLCLIIIIIIIIIISPYIVENVKSKVSNILLFEKVERLLRLVDVAVTLINLVVRDKVNAPSVKHARDLQCIHFFFNGLTTPWGPRPPHCSRLHDHTWDTPHSVGLLWTRDQPVAETSIWQHTTLKRDRHPCPRRDSKPQSQ